MWLLLFVKQALPVPIGPKLGDYVGLPRSTCLFLAEILRTLSYSTVPSICRAISRVFTFRLEGFIGVEKRYPYNGGCLTPHILFRLR